MDFEVLTVATGETAGLRRLGESMARFGAVLSVLGRGEVFRGFGWRWKRLVQGVRESQAEVVLHVDGYDTVCLGPVEDLVGRFLKMVAPEQGGQVVSPHPSPLPGGEGATEAGLGVGSTMAQTDAPLPLTPALSPGEREKPAIVFSSEWNAQPEPWLWLNPGMMIARRKDFLEVFDQPWLEEVFPDHFNDMFQLQLLYGDEPDLFWVDRGNELFFTVRPDGHIPEGLQAGWVHGPNGAWGKG